MYTKLLLHIPADGPTTGDEIKSLKSIKNKTKKSAD